MKRKGCTDIYHEDLEEDLRKTFDRVMNEHGGQPMSNIYLIVSKSPAPRFYVTTRRAVEVISRMHSMRPMRSLTPNKEEMYIDIYNKTKELMERTGKSLKDCVNIVINRRAPSFYLSPGSVRNIIEDMQRRRRRTRYGKVHKH